MSLQGFVGKNDFTVSPNVWTGVSLTILNAKATVELVEAPVRQASVCYASNVPLFESNSGSCIYVTFIAGSMFGLMDSRTAETRSSESWRSADSQSDARGLFLPVREAALEAVTLDRANKTDLAVQHILLAVSQYIRAKRLTSADVFLRYLGQQETSIALKLAGLTATLPVKSKIKSRGDLVDICSDLIRRTGRDPAKVMRGLY